MNKTFTPCFTGFHITTFIDDLLGLDKGYYKENKLNQTTSIFNSSSIGVGPGLQYILGGKNM